MPNDQLGDGHGKTRRVAPPQPDLTDAGCAPVVIGLGAFAWRVVITNSSCLLPLSVAAHGRTICALADRHVQREQSGYKNHNLGNVLDLSFGLLRRLVWHVS